MAPFCPPSSLHCCSGIDSPSEGKFKARFDLIFLDNGIGYAVSLLMPSLPAHFVAKTEAFYATSNIVWWLPWLPPRHTAFSGGAAGHTVVLRARAHAA